MILTDDLRKKTGLDDALGRAEPASVFGRDLLRRAAPVEDRGALGDEYDNIETCLGVVRDTPGFGRYRDLLGRFRDIRGTFRHCEQGQTLDELELFEIKRYLFLLRELAELGAPPLKNVTFYDFARPVALLDPDQTGTASFSVYDSYSEELRTVRAAKRETERGIYAARGAGRDELFAKRRALVEREKEEELAVRARLTRALSAYARQFAQAADSVARFDLCLAKAKMAAQYGLCRPAFCEEPRVGICGGIHPAVRDAVRQRGRAFCPVTLSAGGGATVITGANMGGKTVALSTVALNYLLACMGFFVFAQSLEFFPFGFVAFLSDAVGSPENGLSSFGAEAMGLRKTLDRLESENGLLLVDEFARGTNPAEGSSLVKALVKYLNGKKSVSILTTHYDGVSRYAGGHYRVRGLSRADWSAQPAPGKNSLETIAACMDYTLEKAADGEVPHEALRICSFFGIKDEIISSARAFLREVPPAGAAPAEKGAKIRNAEQTES